MLSFAATARDLGKFRLGRQIIDDLLCEPPHPSLLANALVLASSLWLGLGSGQVAAALVHQARRCVQPKNLKQGAWVFHQEAKVLLETGRPREAYRALGQALARYRKLKDHYGETRCETLRIRVLEALGQPAAALRCAERVVRGAERHEHTRLAVMGRLEHGRLLMAAGQSDEALPILRAGLAGAVVLGDRNAQLMAHHRLWKTYASLGDEEQARVELAAATQLVRFVDDCSPEAEELRVLAKGGTR
jgi:tetratricopeptide (TPR) repeat protein